MTLADISCRTDGVLLEKLGTLDVQLNGLSQTFGFLKARLRVNDAVGALDDIGANNENSPGGLASQGSSISVFGHKF